MSTALQDELTLDPAGLGYAPHIASGNDAAIYGLMTDKSTGAKMGWISVADLNKWCAQYNAEYQLLKARAANSADPLNSAAESILRSLNGAVDDGALDLGDPDIYGLLDAQWTFADLTGATKDALIALGTYPASRAELLGLPVSIQDIANALRP